MLIKKIIQIGTTVGRLKAIIIASISSVFVVIFLILEITNQATGTQALSVDGEHITIDNPTYDFIVNTYRQLDRIGRRNFEYKLIGEKVFWIGEVVKITGGRVVIRVGNEKHNLAQFFIFPVRDILSGEMIEIKAEIIQISLLLGRITIDLTNHHIRTIDYSGNSNQNQAPDDTLTPTKLESGMAGRTLLTKAGILDLKASGILDLIATLTETELMLFPSPTITWILVPTLTPTYTATNRRPPTSTVTPTPSLDFTTTPLFSITPVPTTAEPTIETLVPPDSPEPTSTATPTPTKTPRKPVPTTVTPEPIEPSLLSDSRKEV